MTVMVQNLKQLFKKKKGAHINMKSYQFDKTLNAYMEDGKNKTELPGQAEVS